MQTLLKVILSAGIVLGATALAKRHPSLAGLVGVMPLTGAMVLAWVYVENRGDPQVLAAYARGALWGLLPVVLFYGAAWAGVRREVGLGALMALSFAAWLVGAAVHQHFLK